MPPAWVTQAFAGNCCLPIGALEDDESVDRAVLPNFVPLDQHHKIVTLRRPPYTKNYVPVAARFAPDSNRSYIASKVLDRLGNDRTPTKIVCACPCDNCPHRGRKRNIPGSKGEGKMEDKMEDKMQPKVATQEMEDVGKVTLDWTDDELNNVKRKMQELEREAKRMKRIAKLKTMFSLKKSLESKSKRKGMDIKGKGVDRDDMIEIDIELQPIESAAGEIKIEPGQKASVTIGGPLPCKEAEIWHRGIFYVVEGSEVEPGIEMVLSRYHAAKIRGLLGLAVESTTRVKQEIVDAKTGEVTENALEAAGLIRDDPDPSYQSIFGHPES